VFKRKSVSVCKRQREERGRKTKERDRQREKSPFCGKTVFTLFCIDSLQG
jgi:hypothetical protein